MSEKVVQVPLFEQVAAELLQNGTFQLDFTGQDVAGIMSKVVESLVLEQDAVRASIASMNVDIERQQGSVSGSVNVEEPINATIGVICVLGNDYRTPGRLRLVQLDIKEQAGFLAKMALKAANLKGKAQKALSDPNTALTQALSAQLEPKGVKLTETGLQFKDTALSVSLRGEPIERR